MATCPVCHRCWSLGATVSAQGFQLAGHLVFLMVLGARLYRAQGHRPGRWRGLFRLPDILSRRARATTKQATSEGRS